MFNAVTGFRKEGCVYGSDGFRKGSCVYGRVMVSEREVNSCNDLWCVKKHIIMCNG